MTERIVLAFSGGLASLAAIPWLKQRHGADVVAVTLNLGQRQHLDGIRERALGAGALRCHVLDLEDVFAREAIWPAVRAGVDPGLPGVTLAAPLIARALAETARLENAAAVAHGAAGRQAMQIEAPLPSLTPGLRVLRTAVHELADRAALVAYLGTCGWPAAEADLREDRSLWARTVMGPGLADPWTDAPERAFTLTRPLTACPAEPATLAITFERGVPVAVNGVPMPLAELIDSVATIAGAHGIGRIDLAGIGDDGRQYREVREAPALAVLRPAHEALQRVTIADDADAFGGVVRAQYTAALRDGRWHLPGREALDACLDEIQARMNGVVRLTLFKGACRVAGRRADGYDRSTEATLAASA